MEKKEYISILNVKNTTSCDDKKEHSKFKVIVFHCANKDHMNDIVKNV